MPTSPSQGDTEVRALYQQLLEAWNRRDPDGYAALFGDDGSMVGFDGTQMDGQAAIRDHLRGVFAQHETATYVWIVREVRLLADGAVLLRAVAGMVPPGGANVNPAVNAIQSLIAARSARGWRIALFQNTPAAFHGRPADAERLTDELRAVLRRS